ncbi:hypothetical protein OROHE_006652 [Orobanche hederae]
MRTLASTLSEERSDLSQEPISEPPPEKRSNLVQDPTPEKAPEKRPKLDDSDVSSCLLSKRRVEGTPEDDRRKQAKRPREEDDEHVTDDGYTDGSPFVEDKYLTILCPHHISDASRPQYVHSGEAPNGRSRPLMSLLLSMIRNSEEEEEDYDEEYDYDEGFARREFVCRSFFDEGDFSEDDNENWGGCESCVPEQICGVCGYKDGIPPECPYCGKDGDYLMCRIGPFRDYLDKILKKAPEL